LILLENQQLATDRLDSRNCGSLFVARQLGLHSLSPDHCVSAAAKISVTKRRLMLARPWLTRSGLLL
jgi:hypothetical protein